MKKRRGPAQADFARLIAKLDAAADADPKSIADVRAAVLNVASKLIDLATVLVACEAERFRADHPHKGRGR